MYSEFMKKIAVVLCGSGFKDGSEIRESVATFFALSQNGYEIGQGVEVFAPNAPQTDVVNCLTGEKQNESRNMLVEAARIARGKIKPIEELRTSDFSAILLPGGFGAAKNLCNFAFQGSKGSVIPELSARLEEFYAAKKPIGAICIAPAILALTFKGKGLELTVGESSEASQEIEKLGHKHITTSVHEAHWDSKSHIATTSAYMYDDAKLKDIFAGIEKCVSLVLKNI